MGFVHVAVAVLSFLSVGQSAPVNNCESLSKLIEIQRDQVRYFHITCQRTTHSEGSFLQRYYATDGDTVCFSCWASGWSWQKAQTSRHPISWRRSSWRAPGWKSLHLTRAVFWMFSSLRKCNFKSTFNDGARLSLGIMKCKLKISTQSVQWYFFQAWNMFVSNVSFLLMKGLVPASQSRLLWNWKTALSLWVSGIDETCCTNRFGFRVKHCSSTLCLCWCVLVYACVHRETCQGFWGLTENQLPRLPRCLHELLHWRKHVWWSPAPE